MVFSAKEHIRTEYQQSKLKVHISHGFFWLDHMHIRSKNRSSSAGVLDFSTLSLRKKYCYKEVESNRKLCEEMVLWGSKDCNSS